MDGFIVSFNEERAFGFIQPLIGRPEKAANVFFHVSSLINNTKTAPVGARVSFRLVDGEKGPQAADVVLKRASGSALLTERPRST